MLYILMFILPIAFWLADNAINVNKIKAEDAPIVKVIGKIEAWNRIYKATN